MSIITITKFLNKELGSFECTNLLGQIIGGQLSNGTTYLYLYHDDGSYIKTYSDGDNRYYNKVGYWDRTAKIDIENNGNQKIYLKNGKIITYMLDGRL